MTCAVKMCGMILVSMVNKNKMHNCNKNDLIKIK